MLFIPLRKVDSGRRIVIARLDETPDRAGMVLDYESSKPAFQAWSENMRKATSGLSLGNVREMHGLRAVGRVTRMDFLDAEKAIEFEIEVIDDDAMLKIETGILTGVSQGGKYGRRWHDGMFKRYTAGAVHELSLVDYPCIPDATFSMIKAGGAEESISLVGSDDGRIRYVADLLVDSEDLTEYRDILLAQPSVMLKALFPKDGPEGMQTRDFDPAERDQHAQKGDALQDGSFPIVEASDVAHAVRAMGLSQEADMVKVHIIARAEALGATDQLPAGWIAAAATTTEEAAGAPPSAEDMAKASLAEDMAKAGARNSSADLSHIQAIHDHARELGAVCGDEDAGGTTMVKLAGELHTYKHQLGSLRAENTALTKRLAELERTPLPGGPVRTNVAIHKSQDGHTGASLKEKAAADLAAINAMPDGQEKTVALVRHTMKFQ